MAPSTYANWVAVLDAFANGDDTLINQMQAGSFHLDAGTAQRFYLRVEQAYKKRKQCWLEKFQRSFKQGSIRTDGDFELALRNGKQNLLPLVQFILVPAFPDDLKKTLNEDLVAFLDEIKKSFKDNAAKMGNSKEKFLLILNSFSLPEARKITF